MKKNVNEMKIRIPQGFFGGNCSDCTHWEPYNRASDGRAYCDHYDNWYYPSERRGCFAYERNW